MCCLQLGKVIPDLWNKRNAKKSHHPLLPPPAGLKLCIQKASRNGFHLINSVWKLAAGLQAAEEGSSGTAFSRRSGWQAAAWLVLWWSLFSLRVGLCGAVAWDSKGLDAMTFEISFHHVFFKSQVIIDIVQFFFMEATLVYTSWESALVWLKSRLATFNPCDVW